jgi:hypothetical protein
VNAGFVMCQNPACCLILDLRQARHSIRRSTLLTKGCPECGHPWAERCPVCLQSLSAVRKGRYWRCRSCERSKASNTTRGRNGSRGRSFANGRSSVSST